MTIKLLTLAATIAMTGTMVSAQETRTVDTLFGPADLPVAPERVFVEDPWTLGNVLILGVKPVAVAVFAETTLDYLGDRMDGVAQIAWGDDGPSIEEIGALDPDLIVSRGGNSYGNFNEERCTNYAAVAPTYCFNFAWNTLEEMHQNLMYIADGLNKTEEGVAVLAEYDARIASLAERVAATDLPNNTIAVMRIRPSGYQYRNGQEGILIKAIGLQLPADQMDPFGDFDGDISLENLDAITADALFIQIDPGMDAEFKAMQDNPLYATLPAVQNDRVFLVSTGVWNSFDIIAQHKVMDDLEKFLVVPAEEAN